MKAVTTALICLGLTVSSAHAADNISTGHGWTLNYDWLNQIVNTTPVKDGICPTLDVDTYKNGYRVALQTSFYGSVSPSISKWFPTEEIWTSLSIGPMINKFAITFSNINSLSELDREHAKKLPTTGSELSKWKVSDSAYWESQGGVSFYLGAGKDVIGVGLFAVASGGWANYLEKTGPNTVYVERAKKNVKSVNVGGGVGRISVGFDKYIESAKGFNYEFTLDNSANVEAFERFMAGDTTKAFELSQIANSGVRKIADTSMSKSGRAFGMSIATPFIPIISLRASTGKDMAQEEEYTIWDEHVVKNYGVYTRQNSSRLLGLHQKKATTFTGGVTTIETGAENDKLTSEKFYGNFKHTYQSDWGQEGILGSEVTYARELAGLEDEAETCVKVPNLRKTLGYNQVILQVNFGDQYMREIMGFGSGGSQFLSDIEYKAKSYDSDLRAKNGCFYEENNNNPATSTVCKAPSVESVFSDIRKYARRVKASLGNDQDTFSYGMANFGKAVWSNPAVFKAFFEKGKSCGVDITFEVSGQRLSRFLKTKKYPYNDTCVR